MSSGLEKEVLNRSPNWNDLRVSATVTAKGGIRDPDFVKFADNGAGSTGVYTYAFASNIEEELFFITQMPHSWAIGTDVDVHVHWGASSAAVGDVVWGIELTTSGIGGSMATTTIYTATGATTGTAKTNEYTDIVNLNTAGWELSQLLVGRIFREAGNVADTYNADAYLFELDFHFQQDSSGSKQEFSK